MNAIARDVETQETVVESVVREESAQPAISELHALELALVGGGVAIVLF